MTWLEKHTRIESARRRRHRKLDVIEIDDFAHNSLVRAGGITFLLEPHAAAT
jgi:hypothetical protein